MKKKAIHIDYGRLEIETIEDKGMKKYMLHDSLIDNSIIAQWYMPINSDAEYGDIKKAIDYRLKRDFNITVDHYSVCHLATKR